MTARRKPSRQRDLVSFGRRTPRCNFVLLRQEVAETTKLVKIVAHPAFRRSRMGTEETENLFTLQ